MDMLEPSFDHSTFSKNRARVLRHDADRSVHRRVAVARAGQLLDLVDDRLEEVGPERVAREANAPVVARMDADDISYPRRLEEQLEVLDRSPEVGVVGGLYDIIDASGRKIRGPEAWRLVHPASVPPFGNGPLMYRREVFEEVGGYRKQCEFWEDHDLIIRMGAVSTIMIIPHAIYQVRQSPASTRFASEQRRVERALDLMYRCRERLEQHRTYDDVLGAPARADARLDPRVFISVGQRRFKPSFSAALEYPQNVSRLRNFPTRQRIEKRQDAFKSSLLFSRLRNLN